MKAVPIPISLIRITTESQCRATTDRRTVEEYAEAWKADAEFPPVDLFTQGSEYYPGDGMHRILAAKRVGMTTILAYLRRGDERDAFLHGCASNHTHGLRRTNLDKRHMVSRMLNDIEWVKWSDRRIAEQCGVSAQFVANVRHQLSTVDGSPAWRHADNPRLGADGKLRKPPDSNNVKCPAICDSPVRLTKISLTAGASGTKRGSRDWNGEAGSQRQEALVLLERLRQVLKALDIYGSCALEVESISEKVKQLSLVGMTA